MISNRQRKLFFIYVRRVGKQAAYDMLSVVTKGIISLRDKRLSPNIMKTVLSELSIRFPKVEKAVFHQAPVHKAKELNRAPQIKRRGQQIYLISRDLLNGIETMRKSLKMNDFKYLLLCRRLINNDRPMSKDHGIAILRELTRLKSEAVKSRSKKG
jgi:hypothetical protein